MAKKTGKNKKAKQGSFTGVLPKIDEKLIDLATELREIRATRMRIQTEETELQTNLIDAMREAKLDFFEDGGFIVKLVTGKDKVSVRATKDSDSEPDDLSTYRKRAT